MQPVAKAIRERFQHCGVRKVPPHPTVLRGIQILHYRGWQAKADGLDSSTIVRNQPSFAIIAAEAGTSAGRLSEPVTAEPVTAESVTAESDRPPAAVSELGQRNECPI